MPWPLTSVHSALTALLQAFPAHLEKAHVLTMYDRDPQDRPDWDAFENFVRAHKRDRLAMPAHALLHWEHRLIRDSLRRFAYFVPSLLAGCVREELSWSTVCDLARRAHDAESIYHPDAPASFTDQERLAMRDFFIVALEHNIQQAKGDDGWQLFRCACGLDAYPVDVLVRWISFDDAASERALVDGLRSSSSTESDERVRVAILSPEVRTALERRFFSSTNSARGAVLSDGVTAIDSLSLRTG